MASSFNSKEIIKILPIDKRTISPSPARVIRGLYVAGVWRPPHYIDRTLIITSITTNIVKVSYYTTTDKHVLPGDMAFGHKGISSTGLNVIKYTTKNDHILPGNMAFGHKDIIATGLTLEKWKKINQNVLPGNMAFGYEDILIQQPLTVLSLHTNQIDLSPGQPLLQITSISTEHASVERRS